MRPWLSRFGAFTILFCVYLGAVAQELDSNLTSQNRNPGKIADEISDKAEDNAFLNLYHQVSAKEKLQAAQAFVQKFPQSAFLAQAFEVEARSSFDEGDYAAGLEYARQSLALLPENPLLLVAVADVQAQQSQDDAAIASARDALEYFDRFARPRSVPENDWPGLKRRQQASAHFVTGRAQLHKGLLQASPELRRTQLAQSVISLKQAHSLNPADDETTYLLGVAYLSAGEPKQASGQFADVYERGGVYASRALAALQQIYRSIPPGSKTDFASFLKDAQTAKEIDPPSETVAQPDGVSTHRLSD